MKSFFGLLGKYLAAGVAGAAANVGQAYAMNPTGMNGKTAAAAATTGAIIGMVGLWKTPPTMEQK
jgi:hypothetical protein